MAVPGTLPLAASAPPPASGVAPRSAPGAARGRNDGTAGFAGALAAAAQSRDADPADTTRGVKGPSATEGQEGTDDAGSAAEARTEDKKPVPAASDNADAAAAALALPPRVDVLDLRPPSATPPEVADRVDGRFAGGLRGMTDAPGDRRLPPASDPALADDGARQTTHDLAAMTAGAAPIDTTADPARAAATAGAAQPLPGLLDPTQVDPRRAARPAGSRTDQATPAGSALSEQPTRVLQPAAGARAMPASDPATAPTTRTLQDTTAVEARLGVADPKVSEAALPTDPRQQTLPPSPGLAASNAGNFVAKAAEAPARFEAQLEAALHSPEFVPSLGAQVSTLVRNGIPEARLHLHPAELGPITVQIEIDGQSAQVNMAVEHAATRQVLEQAIPTLASALRDSGLTLTGGGVFQQPRDPHGTPGERNAAGGRRSGSADDADALPAAAPRARIQRGALDVYA